MIDFGNRSISTISIIFRDAVNRRNENWITSKFKISHEEKGFCHLVIRISSQIVNDKIKCTIVSRCIDGSCTIVLNDLVQYLRCAPPIGVSRLGRWALRNIPQGRMIHFWGGEWLQVAGNKLRMSLVYQLLAGTRSSYQCVVK